MLFVYVVPLSQFCVYKLYEDAINRSLAIVD